MLLREDYFGKDKILLECEAILSEIVKGININPYIDVEYEFKKIEDLLCKKFNFETVTINWIPSTTVPNAMTLPITSTLLFSRNSEFDIQENTTGMRFKDSKGKHLDMYVYAGLITTTGLTSSELLAIMLHEIGHNFFSSKFFTTYRKTKMLYSLISIVKKILSSPAPVVQKLMNIVITMCTNLLVLTKSGRKIKNKAINDNRELNRLMNIITAWIQDVSSVASSILNIGTPFWLKLLKSKALRLSFLKHLTHGFLDLGLSGGLYDEQFADDFATMHGYGPELAGSMAKFNLNNRRDIKAKILKGTPFELYFNAVNFLDSSILSIADCHPNDYSRVYSSIVSLEKELNNGKLPPSIKKEVMEDLKKVKETYALMKDSKHLKENNEHVKLFFYSVFGFPGEERKEIKEYIFGKDKNTDLYKPMKDRKLKGMFL